MKHNTFIKVNKKYIKCLSNKTLTEDHINLLAKGLKFIQINTSDRTQPDLLEEYTSNTCNTEKKKSFPYQIKKELTSATNENKKDACIIKKGPVWKSCQEQTTVIIVVNYHHQFFPTSKLRHGKLIS